MRKSVLKTAKAKTRALPATTGCTIGEAAKRAGCTPEAIRYYEREGVLPAPPRSGQGRYRRYSPSDVEQLRFLRRARDLGFSVQEVRELLTLASGDQERSCGNVDRLARAHLARVDTKLARLGALRAELARVVEECQGLAVADCRILGALAGD